jgi:hypothetical protein
VIAEKIAIAARTVNAVKSVNAVPIAIVVVPKNN